MAFLDLIDGQGETAIWDSSRPLTCSATAQKGRAEVNMLKKKSTLASLMVAALVVFSGCARRIQPGRIKASDMRQHLSAEVLKFETKPSFLKYYSQQIRVGPESALITITWSALDLAEGKYLRLITASLDAPVSYDLLDVSEPTKPVNIGTDVPKREMSSVTISWSKKHFLSQELGTSVFQFSADGTGKSVQ